MTQPGEKLGEYVRGIWTLELPASITGQSEDPIVPDGCPELIFNLGDPIHRAHSSGYDVHIRPQLAGQLTRAITLRPQGRVSIVGVRLHPWAMHALLGVGPRETRERIVPADLAIGTSLTAALDAIDPATDPGTFARALTCALTRHVANRPAPEPAATTVYRALRHSVGGDPDATVRSVARTLGRSERQLQRVFEESVGISPKMYLRLNRIQRTLRFAERHPEQSWSAIAASCHFYDHSHLVRDMQRFAGCSPTEFDARAGVFTRSLVG